MTGVNLHTRGCIPRGPHRGARGENKAVTASKRSGNNLKTINYFYLLKNNKGVLPSSQGQDLALTVLCVPHSLDSGYAPGRRTRVGGREQTRGVGVGVGEGAEKGAVNEQGAWCDEGERGTCWDQGVGVNVVWRGCGGGDLLLLLIDYSPSLALSDTQVYEP